MTSIVAIDGMGGDSAPDLIEKGLVRVLGRYKEVLFHIFGKEEVWEPILSKNDLLARNAVLFHCDCVVGPETKPSLALKSLRTSSMGAAIRAVASGQAQGVVSAGNTGAYMALSKFFLQTLPDIDRPAIAAIIPTLKGRGSVFLDVGGNTSCSARNLLEFAIMGRVFARHRLGIQDPSVGLLNVGSEAGKGSPFVQDVAALLQANPTLHFDGFLEGDELFSGRCDVVLTDGFTGNVALKVAEGVADSLFYLIRNAFHDSWLTRLRGAVAKAPLSKVKTLFDPRRYNGAVWLGLKKGLAIKSHGGTDAVGFAFAVEGAIDLIRSNVQSALSQAILEGAEGEFLR